MQTQYNQRAVDSLFAVLGNAFLVFVAIWLFSQAGQKNTGQWDMRRTPEEISARTHDGKYAASIEDVCIISKNFVSEVGKQTTDRAPHDTRVARVNNRQYAQMLADNARYHHREKPRDRSNQADALHTLRYNILPEWKQEYYHAKNDAEKGSLQFLGFRVDLAGCIGGPDPYFNF